MRARVARIAAHRLFYATVRESRRPVSFYDCLTRPVHCFQKLHARSSCYSEYLQSRCFSTKLQTFEGCDIVYGQEEIEVTMVGGSSASSGIKRKRASPVFYAVKSGFTPGIYQSWDDAKQQTSGFKNPIVKKCTLYTEAEDFMKGASSAVPRTGKSKYYGVQVGHTPGVYTDWPAVLEQVTGFKGGKQKRFDTWEEAQAYVNEAQQGAAFSHTNTSTPISLNGHLDSTTPSVVESRKSTKKQKQNDNSALATPADGDYEAGTGPLPPDTEDGFDRRIKHGRPGGPQVEYKTQDELFQHKLQPTGDFNGVLEIYTDGASKGNGQLGAYAGFGIWFGPNDPRNDHGPLPGERQTNQRAELTAIARAIDIAPIDREAKIFTDSHYSMKCLTDWFQSWEAKGWKSAAGRPVENRDLIEPILARIRERETARAKTHIVWLKAHNGNTGNEAADRLANEGAEEKRQELEVEKMMKAVTAEFELEGQEGQDDIF